MNRIVAMMGAALIGAAVPILIPAQASADNCHGYNGRWFSTSTCEGGYNCSSVAIGPWWSSNCNPVNPQQQPWQPWQP